MVVEDTMTIYDIICREHDNKGFVKIPYLNERLSASIGSHIANVRNMDLAEVNPQLALFEGGECENLRTHCVLMFSSGFGKSSEMRHLLAARSGLLSKSKFFNTTIRSTFTPESWVGTALKDKEGQPQIKQGLFDRYKRGIVGADEFMRFTRMMDTSAVHEATNEEVYLLTALQHSSLTKEMSYATVESGDIGTTLWVGCRPTRVDMRHGLARRVSFHIFTPTPKICTNYKEMNWLKNKGGSTLDAVKEDMAETILDVTETMTDMNLVDYEPLKEYFKRKFPNTGRYPLDPHFETSIYKRLALGFSVATGTFPKIVMDDRLCDLIDNEIKSRHVIRNDPEIEIVRKIVEEEPGITGKELTEFMSIWCQFTDIHCRKLINLFKLKFKPVVVKVGKTYEYTLR